jgi:hypothetical protein
MQELLKNYQKLDKFIKMQLFMLFIVTLSWSLVIPIVTKLQGLLWTTSMISLYLILQKVSVFIMPYFKNINLITSYKTLILMDIIYTLSILTYFADKDLFVYIEAVVIIIYGLCTSVFGINYSMYVMKRYNEHIFKDTQYLEQMIMATAGILGYLIVIAVGELTQSMDMNIKTFLFFIVVSLLIQFYNYQTYWKKLEFEEN